MPHMCNSNQFAGQFGSRVIFKAAINSDPVKQNYKTTFEIRPEGYAQNVQVVSFRNIDYFYGEEIYFIGKLREPKSSPDFDYIDYLRAKNIYAQSASPEIYIIVQHKNLIFYALQLKHWLISKFQILFDKEQAGLLIALLTGQKNFMSDQAVAGFNLTGTAHMIAVSGYKLTLLMIAIGSLAAYFGRKSTLILAIATAFIYAAFAGFEPAVMRALIMSGIFLLAQKSGRKFNLLTALLLTAAILVAANPLIVRYDLGFILSFTGIIGIIIFAPLLNAFLQKVPSKFGIKEIFVSTASAQIVTMPIMAYYFHQFTPVAPIINLLIVPLLAPIIISGYFCALPLVGKIISWPVKIVLNYFFVVTQTALRLPFSFFAVNISERTICIIYALEILLYFGINNWLKSRKENVKITTPLKE